MKTSIILTATIAFLGLAVASTFAQTQSTATSSTTYVQASKIVGTKVKSSQGEEVGVIKDVVLDRNTGCMAYTVLSASGAGARAGGKMVAVPWSVYSPTSNISELTVNVDRERIYNAPAFDYARIEEYSRPDYITNVYSYYGVSPGAGVGIGVSGSSTTTGATTTTGAATGAAARAGTTASPAGPSSPAATSSSPGAKSPLPQTSASPARSPSTHATAGTTPHAARGGRPHETLSPSTRGGATGTSPTEEKRGTRGTREETTSPAGRSETGARSETERAPSEATSPGEKATGTQHRQRGKREAGTPSERPPGED